MARAFCGFVWGMQGPTGLFALSVGGLAAAAIAPQLGPWQSGGEWGCALGWLFLLGVLLRFGQRRWHVDVGCAMLGGFLFVALVALKEKPDMGRSMDQGRGVVRCTVLSRMPQGSGFEMGLAEDDEGKLLHLTGRRLPAVGTRSLGIARPLSPSRAEHEWEFDGVAHDRSKGIHQRWRWEQTLTTHTPTTWLHRWRSQWGVLREVVKSRILLGSTEAGPAFLLGMMTGDRSALPRSVRRAFSEVGLGHLTAVSGFHVGLVLAGCVALFRGLGVRARWRAAAALPMVWGFVLLCGLPPSAARAAVMATAGGWPMR